MPSDSTVEISLESVWPSGGSGEPPPPPSRSEHADLSGQLLGGRYRLIRTIGRGGMGAVYLAKHLALDKHFAIKVLGGRFAAHAQATHRFAREARATSRLHHDNVVDVCDFGVSEGRVYLVMEYLEGEDLAAVLRRDGPMPWHRVSRILLQVCAALQAAHALRIIHRDIKPSNCLRLAGDDDDRIKVLDFGVAKVLGGDGGPRVETEAHIVVGTPEYMAPESFAQAPVDARVDIYAVGMLGYHLLTGTLPFDRSRESFLRDVCAGLQRPPSKGRRGLKIPRIADAIIVQALRPEPSDRYQTIAELGAAIAAAIEPSSGASSSRGRTGLESVLDRPTALVTLIAPRPGPPTWRAVLVSLVVLVLLGMSLWQPDPPAEVTSSPLSTTPTSQPAPPAEARAPAILVAAPVSQVPAAELSEPEPPPRPVRAQRRRSRAPVDPPPQPVRSPEPEPAPPPRPPLWIPASNPPQASDMLRPPQP